jgi:hypothetical protein
MQDRSVPAIEHPQAPLQVLVIPGRGEISLFRIRCGCAAAARRSQFLYQALQFTIRKYIRKRHIELPAVSLKIGGFVTDCHGCRIGPPRVFLKPY